jgi:hypothetical protein
MAVGLVHSVTKWVYTHLGDTEYFDGSEMLPAESGNCLIIGQQALYTYVQM